MGFSVQQAVLRGRPSDADLERIARRALARLEVVRTPLLVAAGRTDAAAAPFTVVFLSRGDVGLEVPLLEAPARRHDLPAVPVDAVAEDVDPFLLSIALVAQSEGIDAAYLSDSSISDGGALVVAGKPVIRWDADSADEQRERADDLLRAVFGDQAPDLEELTWLGLAASHWQRRLPVAARPSAGGLFRRVKKTP